GPAFVLGIEASQVIVHGLHHRGDVRCEFYFYIRDFRYNCLRVGPLVGLTASIGPWWIGWFAQGRPRVFRVLHNGPTGRHDPAFLGCSALMRKLSSIFSLESLMGKSV